MIMQTTKKFAIPQASMTDFKDKLAKIEKDLRHIKLGNKRQNESEVRDIWPITMKSPFL